MILRKVRLLFLFLSISVFCSILCSCRRYHYPEGETAVAELSEYIEAEKKNSSFSLWTSSVNESSMELCFQGECSLQGVLGITECANQYLETHPEFIAISKAMELRISFFPNGSTKRDRQNLNYYASVRKPRDEKKINALEIHTNETIMISAFRDCGVSLEYVIVPYNVLFDDPEALLSIEGLKYFQFTDRRVKTDIATLVEVLQAVCYYEDHNITPTFQFTFGLDDELKKEYRAYVESHPDYKVFSSFD